MSKGYRPLSLLLSLIYNTAMMADVIFATARQHYMQYSALINASDITGICEGISYGLIN